MRNCHAAPFLKAANIALIPLNIIQFTCFSNLIFQTLKMAAPSFPPGGTFIDTLQKSFVDVPVNAANDNAINTTAFLQAAESLTTLFGAQTHTCSIS